MIDSTVPNIATVNGVIMDSEIAAARMRLSINTIRKYVRLGKLKPLMVVGTSYVFTQQECDRYNRERVDRGRPPRRAS